MKQQRISRVSNFLYSEFSIYVNVSFFEITEIRGANVLFGLFLFPLTGEVLVSKNLLSRITVTPLVISVLKFILQKGRKGAEKGKKIQQSYLVGIKQNIHNLLNFEQEHNFF